MTAGGAAPRSRDALCPGSPPPAPPPLPAILAASPPAPGGQDGLSVCFMANGAQGSARQAWRGRPSWPAPSKTAFYRRSSCLHFLPARASAFQRRPAGPSVPRAGRGVKDVRDGDRENSTSASPLRGQQPGLSPSRPLPQGPLPSTAITSGLPQRFPTCPPIPRRQPAATFSPPLTCHLPSPSPSCLVGPIPTPSIFFRPPIAAKLSLSPHFPPWYVLLGAPALRSALPHRPPQKKGHIIFLPAWSRGTFPCLQPRGLIPSCVHPPGRGVPGRGGLQQGTALWGSARFWEPPLPPRGSPMGSCPPQHTRGGSSPYTGGLAQQEEVWGPEGEDSGDTSQRRRGQGGLGEATLELIRGGRRPGGSVPGRGGTGGRH